MNAVQWKRRTPRDDDIRRLLLREVELPEFQHDVVANSRDLSALHGELVAVNSLRVRRAVFGELPVQALKLESAHLVAEIRFDGERVYSAQDLRQAEGFRLEHHPLRLLVVGVFAQHPSLPRDSVVEAYLHRIKGIRPYRHRHGIRTGAEVHVIERRPGACPEAEAYSLIHALAQVVARPGVQSAKDKGIRVGDGAAKPLRPERQNGQDMVLPGAVSAHRAQAEHAVALRADRYGAVRLLREFRRAGHYAGFGGDTVFDVVRVIRVRREYYGRYPYLAAVLGEQQPVRAQLYLAHGYFVSPAALRESRGNALAAGRSR